MVKTYPESVWIWHLISEEMLKTLLPYGTRLTNGGKNCQKTERLIFPNSFNDFGSRFSLGYTCILASASGVYFRRRWCHVDQQKHQFLKIKLKNKKRYKRGGDMAGNDLSTKFRFVRKERVLQATNGQRTPYLYTEPKQSYKAKYAHIQILWRYCKLRTFRGPWQTWYYQQRASRIKTQLYRNSWILTNRNNKLKIIIELRKIWCKRLIGRK